MKKLLTILVVLSLAFALFANGTQEAAKPADAKTPQGPYVISGGPNGGNAYRVSAAFADVWTKAGCLVDIIPGGGTANIVGVNNGTYEIGWAMESNLMEAISGTESFDQKYTEVSQIVRLDENPCIIIVPADSDIKSLKDLKGKTIATPAAGTSSQIFVKHILTLAGFNMEKDFKLREGGITGGIDLFRDRLVDAIVTTTSYPNASLSELTMSIPCRFIPLDDATVSKLEKFNVGYTEFTYPDETYKGMGKGYRTISSAGVILVNNSMDEDVVYWLTKAMNEGWEDVGMTISGVRGIEAPARASSKTPMHPGAERYYKEIGAR